MLCSLLGRTSALNPRCLRLCFLQLSALFTISCSALYIDIVEDVEKNNSFSNAELAMIGLLGAVASMVMILIFALLFKICSVKLTSTTKTRSSEILEEYAENKRKVNCRLLFGIIVFVGVSVLLCLYLIGFCHISDATVEDDWIKSSIVGLITDLLLIESLIAAIFGLFGSFWGCCGKCGVCLLLPCQGIRRIKSLD